MRPGSSVASLDQIDVSADHHRLLTLVGDLHELVDEAGVHAKPGDIEKK